MNLHGIASGIISAVNPMISATITASNSYTTADDGSQIPTYVDPLPASIQVQELSTWDLKQIDGLNLQGNLRKVWMNGNWNGIVRPDGKGGDLLRFNSQNWLVVHVLEQWPDWTSVVVSRQL